MKQTFPKGGLSREEILAAISDNKAHDLKVDGRAFAFIYDAGDEARALARDAYAACMSINGLDPTVYPSARKLENAVVGACLDMLQAPEGAVGTATAGGTESVMLAVKAARDYARKTRPEVKTPKMILPETAHACFHKAAHYLGIEILTIGTDETMRASVAEAREKMDDQVILVVGSAPSYAHGVVDPIPELAALASENGALMHVDACVGGLVLPFLRDNGVDVPPFDFAVPGVTSISADLHKYGFAPKGVSVVLQRDPKVRAAQFFTCANWTGYTVINSTTLGSKSVSALGGAFALMNHLGREGYGKLAAKMWDATKKATAAVERIEGIRLLAKPDMNLFAFTTEEGDIFDLSDRLTECGWHVQPTYRYGNSPTHIHLTIEPTNADHIDDFIADLEKCMVNLPAAQEAPEQVVMLLDSLGNADGDDGLDPGMLMGQLGITDGKLPAQAAMIHRLLDAASPAAREQLLVLFFGELFS